MEWIDVRDRLPGPGDEVLCVNSFNEFSVCCIEKRWADEPAAWRCEATRRFYPTHWMPLPLAPQGEPSEQIKTNTIFREKRGEFEGISDDCNL